MAVDRFTRYKALKALWARARGLMAWLVVPHAREAQARTFRWQMINVAERQIADGVVRGTGDPDSALRPQAGDGRPMRPPAEWERQRQEWQIAHQQWYDSQARVAQWLQQRRGR